MEDQLTDEDIYYASYLSYLEMVETGCTTMNDMYFTTEEIIGNQEKVSVSYTNLNKDLEVGDRILLNNGLMEFVVESIKGKDIHTKVTVGGELSDRKSMSFPNKVL